MSAFTEQYKKNRAEQPAQIVEVIPPSGFVFKFRRPQVLSFLMKNGLPSEITAEAAKGLPSSESVKNLSPEQAQSAAELLLKMRDEILKLSVEPKIVLENAKDDEMGVEDISDDDLAFFIIWYRSGGEVSDSLKTFRPKQEPTSGTRVNGKKRGGKSK